MASLANKSGIITRSMVRNGSRACSVPIKRKDDNVNIDVDKQNLDVVHHPDKNMFIMKIGSTEGIVEYNLKGNVYDLVHSQIPRNMQGHGLGKILAQVRHYCSEESPAIVELDLYKNEVIKQFTMRLNGVSVTIDYDLADGVYNLSNTTVPKDYRKRGIGRIMAQKTFEYIIKQDKKMKLTCEFLEHYYKGNEKHYSKYVV